MQKRNSDYDRPLAHRQTAILKKYYVLPRRYWPDNDRRRIDLHAGRCLECWTLIYEPKRFSCLERHPSWRGRKIDHRKRCPLRKPSTHTERRFAEGIGTNPDELIAASLGGCFSMALSNELGLSGFHPESIETTATATLEDLAAGWTRHARATRRPSKRSGRVSNTFHGCSARGKNKLSHRSSA